MKPWLGLFCTIFLLSSLGCSPKNGPEKILGSNGRFLKSEYIIVGAGIAGLSAAQHLRKLGLKTIILEARAKTGGRVRTVSLGGVKVDMGAAWIHGFENPDHPITKLAKENNVETFITDQDNNALYDSLGEELDSGVIQGLASELLEGLEEQQNELDDSESDETVRGGFDEYVEEEGFAAEALEILKWIFMSEVELELANDGKNLSFKEWGLDLEYGTVDALAVNGLSTIVDKLDDNLDIRLEHVVTNIIHKQDHVLIETNQGTFEAQNVIVTVPISVLKKKHITFDPPLSEEKRSALNRMGMGNMAKVIMKFDNDFWDTQDHLIGYMGESPDTAPRIYQEFYSLDVIDEEANTLVLLTHGESAVSVETIAAQQGGKQQIQDEIMAIFQLIYAEDEQTLAPPSHIEISNWHTDPFSGGAYTSVQVGSSLNDSNILAEHINGTICFAGEATSVKYIGTMHGALNSGTRAVKDCLEN